VSVGGREVQRRVAVVRARVEVCAISNERAHHVDVPLEAHRRVQRRHPNVVRGRRALERRGLVCVGDGVRDLVAALALVRVPGRRHMGVGEGAEGAGDQRRLLRRRHAVADLGPALDEDAADLGEALRGGHNERRIDAGVQVAVVFALHVLGERVDVVVRDRLHERLRLPAQPAALAAHAHRVEVLKLG
jgi:hypothetical protein